MTGAVLIIVMGVAISNRVVALAWLALAGLVISSGFAVWQVAELWLGTRRLERWVEAQAFVDRLTGLPNRQAFSAELRTRLEETAREQGKVIVMVVNVDSFAQINDSMGAQRADRLLCAIGGRLRGILPSTDTLARLDGDEFGIIAVSDYLDLDSQQIADRLLRCFDDKFSVGRRTIAASASIGFVEVHDYEDPEELTRSARWAMREAKRAGKNRVRSVDATFESSTRELVDLEDDLREAIATNQIDVHFQPIVTGDGTIFAYECLARWERRSGERVAPDKFFAVAERIGLSSRLGEQILKKACKTLSRWQDMGAPELSIAVNFSADELAADGFCDMVSDTLTKSDLRPHQLIVEVNDASSAQLFNTLMPTLRTLSARGVIIALDDFGSGFYTISNLEELPVGIVKIDRRFVNSALVDEQSRSLFEYLVNVAKLEQRLTVAEGVESADQQEFAMASGVGLFQGFHVAAPESAAMTETRYERPEPEEPSEERIETEFTGFDGSARTPAAFSTGPAPLGGAAAAAVALLVQPDSGPATSTAIADSESADQSSTE